MRKGRILLALVVALCAVMAHTGAGAEVHLAFYHTDCDECDAVRAQLSGLQRRYGASVVVHDFDFLVASNYLRLVRIEEALGIKKQDPVIVYVGSNGLYGAAAIAKNLETVLANALAHGGAALWEPGMTIVVSAHGGDAVARRFKNFSMPVIILAGLLDGVNPCAFATLVLFATLLACYHRSRREILLTGLVFALGVFLTYLALGMGVLVFLRALRSMRYTAHIIKWALVVFCGVCAILSLHDAWHVHRRHGSTWTMGLPPSWRERIGRLLSAYAGRKRWLAGVFGVGVVIAAIESVCTGQVYVPTLVYMMQVAEQRWQAGALLVLYNTAFILPILVLAVVVASGVRSQRLLEWQKSRAVQLRLAMAALFAGMAALLAFT